MSFPRYEAYKDSGVEWLGEVPEHWEVCRITHHLQSIVDYRGRTPQKDDFGVFLVTAKNIRDGTIDYETSQEFITEKAYQEVIQRGQPSIGDVVFTTEAPLGQVANLDRDDIALAQRVIKFSGIPRVVDNYFLKYWIMGSICQSELESLATGSTALGIKGSKVNQLHFCLPSYLEQTQIARFLDRETARIDALIAEQERLIELLKEKRQAVISHAVTKGLDPTAPMKDSGVEWLGEVPQHWNVKQLKHIVDPATSITYGIVQAGPEVENGIPYIKTSDMAGDELPLIGYCRTSPAIDASYQRSKVSAGDIVVAIRATVGKCLPVPSELEGANLTQGTAKVSPGDSVLADYLLLAMRAEAAQAYFGFMSKGATFKEITLDALRRTPFALPPLSEQLHIATGLKSILGNCETLISEAITTKSLLSERRSALISAAVTGKIDVRGWQASASDSSVPKMEIANG